MGIASRKMNGTRDDSLYGLLSSYKSNSTYIRVLVSDEKNSIALMLADNPKNFFAIPSEKFKNYRPLRRLEMGVAKASLKYVTPENLVAVMGPLMGINIPQEKVDLNPVLQMDGCYIIETSLKFKTRILQGVKKLINMSPQKRYELLEKSFSIDRGF
jgi:hypothetical protein